MFSQNASNCTARNCANTGTAPITDYDGGIFGAVQSNCSAINCINTCPINGTTVGTAGILGYYSQNCTVSNCYNTGTVGVNQFSTAISPKDAVNTTVTNCYTTNGLIAFGTGNTITNCSSNDGGVWKDTVASSLLNAGKGLTGVPISTVYPAYGTVWYSTSPNTPYSLVSFLNSVPCFLAGARILTPGGYRRVETLENGDEVTTSDGRSVPVKIFKTKIAKTDEDTAPFVVAKGAISRNVPDEDLHVSGTHVIQDVRGMWQIPAGLATHPNSGVYQHLPGRPVTYYHVECPNFFTDDLIANNCVVESFRNKQGTSENSYEYDIDVGGFVRVVQESESETGLADKHVLHGAAC
uniref:Hedgehog/Intein (Hint) domain-containing protein n=1 Tax=viral metagenome TaxID=1070528 RepID=A0A6C0HKE1_9ZZZZ